MSERRERLAEALVAQWHREDSRAPGPGPDAAKVEREEAEHYADALLPVVAQEIAEAEQRGREEVRARVEALCVDLERSSLGGNWIRGDERRGCVAEFRAALAEPTPEEPS